MNESISGNLKVILSVSVLAAASLAFLASMKEHCTVLYRTALCIHALNSRSVGVDTPLVPQNAFPCLS